MRPGGEALNGGQLTCIVTQPQMGVCKVLPARVADCTDTCFPQCFPTPPEAVPEVLVIHALGR